MDRCITVRDFINKALHHTLVGYVENRQPFCIDLANKKAKARVCLSSSHASCNWKYKDVLKDDYIVLFNFSNSGGGYCGNAFGLSIFELLKKCETFECFLNFIDKELSRLNIKDYAPLHGEQVKNYGEQLSLF